MRILKATLWGVGGLLVAIAVALVALFAVARQYPSYLEPLAERGATYFLGRELRIGELSKFSLATDATLELRDLELANASWAESGSLLSVGHLELVLHFPSLWQDGSIIVKKFVVEELALELLAPEGMEPNWALPLKIQGGGTEDEPGQVLFPVIIEQARLADVSVTFTDPDQRVVADVQQFRLERDHSTGLSNLDLAGVVNELPLRGGGEIGPTAALQSGRNLVLDLSLELGKMRVHASGSVADALALEGADLHLNVRGPHSRAVLDLLGLEEVRDGPMAFQGTLADASPGLLIEMEGEMAGFGLGAHGRIANPREMDGMQLDFYLDGPSMAEAGAIFGLIGFRDVPYDIAGSLYRRGNVLKIEGGRLRAGEGELALSGVLPHFPDIDDWQAEITGRRLDLSVLGPIAGVQGLPQLFCDVEGRLSSDDQGVELVDVRVTDGDVDLKINGVVGEMPDYLQTKLSARLSGSDLSRLKALIGFETLPHEAYELVGDLSRAADGWRISEGRLLSEGFQVDFSAHLDHLVNARQVDGTLRVSSPDVPAALRQYGVDIASAAPVPLSLDAQARLAEEGFEITSVSGDLGAIRFSGRGWLSAEEDFAGSRLALEATGNNIGEAIAAFTAAELPEQSFTLALDTTYHSPLVSVDRLNLQVGSHSLAGNLTLEGWGDSQVARGKLSLNGDSSRRLLALAGLDLDIADSRYALDADVQMSARQLELKNLQVDGVNSHLGGKLLLAFGEIPRLDVDLHSREVHLPSLWPALAAEDSAVPANADKTAQQNLMEPPTRKEMKERVIPDIPLPLGWVNKVNGNWRYSVDRAWAREGIASQLLVDIGIEDGVMKTRQFAWGGAVSTGWIDLGIDARKMPYRIDLTLASDRIPMLWLIAGKDIPEQKSNYRGSLSATGTTVREAAASLDGEFILRASGAQLSNKGLDLILGDAVGSVFDRLNPFTQTEEYTQVECLAGAMRATNGLISIDPGLVMRTDKIDIVSDGIVDLGTEALNISFNTRSRKGIGISAGKAITPYLKVAGNMAHPWLTVDPEAVAISGTAAVATAGLSIIAESLFDRWIVTAKSPCYELYKKIRKEQDYQQLLLLPEPGLTVPAGAPSIEHEQNKPVSRG